MCERIRLASRPIDGIPAEKNEERQSAPAQAPLRHGKKRDLLQRQVSLVLCLHESRSLQYHCSTIAYYQLSTL
jgi:hypothetical protein